MVSNGVFELLQFVSTISSVKKKIIRYTSRLEYASVWRRMTRPSSSMKRIVGVMPSSRIEHILKILSCDTIPHVTRYSILKVSWKLTRR